MKISKPFSRGIMNARDRPRDEGQSQAERSEWVHSGGRKLENKKDLRVTQAARRQLELLDFRDSFTLAASSSSQSSSSSPSALFSQPVSKVVSYLFMNYATRALPHQRQTLSAKYTGEETFRPPPRKSDVIRGRELAGLMD